MIRLTDNPLITLILLCLCTISLLTIPGSFAQVAEQKSVGIEVDLTNGKGTLKPIWAWFGYDEPNYTYVKDGKKLLTEISN